MKFSKTLSAEFKKELANAIRLSVFLTALVAGFLVFQNSTSTPEEIVASNSRVDGSAEDAAATKKCVVNREGNRVPASETTETDSRVECE
jgi:hypothetical protein